MYRWLSKIYFHHRYIYENVEKLQSYLYLKKKLKILPHRKDKIYQLGISTQLANNFWGIRVLPNSGHNNGNWKHILTHRYIISSASELDSTMGNAADLIFYTLRDDTCPRKISYFAEIHDEKSRPIRVSPTDVSFDRLWISLLYENLSYFNEGLEWEKGWKYRRWRWGKGDFILIINVQYNVLITCQLSRMNIRLMRICMSLAWKEL